MLVFGGVCENKDTERQLCNKHRQWRVLSDMHYHALPTHWMFEINLVFDELFLVKDETPKFPFRFTPTKIVAQWSLFPLLQTMEQYRRVPCVKPPFDLQQEVSCGRGMVINSNSKGLYDPLQRNWNDELSPIWVLSTLARMKFVGIHRHFLRWWATGVLHHRTEAHRSFRFHETILRRWVDGSIQNVSSLIHPRKMNMVHLKIPPWNWS